MRWMKARRFLIITMGLLIFEHESKIYAVGVVKSVGSIILYLEVG